MMTSIDPRPSEDERWEAVRARDAGADGRFVFAVRTTGVYCRPQCPARRPLPGNVAFFDDGAAARAAGFRACKRCRPDERTMHDELIALVERACRTIELAQTAPSLADLAAAAGKSVFHFQRAFKRIVGVTPREYAAGKRAEHLRLALCAHARVTDAVYDAGYGSSSRMYSLAASTLGMSPAAFRAGGRGERVRFATLESVLGWIAVAMTERGVAAIELGASRAAVSTAIRAKFGAADLAEDTAALRYVLASILAYLERPADGLDLPLDVQGTAFSRRVWRALTEIPVGQTTTYAQIAAAIGRPGTARAVASACAANPAALAIPCHRVVPASGGSGGYRRGSARKKSLLDAESA